MGDRLDATMHSTLTEEEKQHLDHLNMEYQYLDALLHDEAEAVTDFDVRLRALPWIQKLSSPEYSAAQFKEKRNKYMAAFSICLMNSLMCGVFSDPPPDGALIELDSLDIRLPRSPSWLNRSSWDEAIDLAQGLPQMFNSVECTLSEHKDGCTEITDNTREMFNDEFFFCMLLAKPYASLLADAEDRAKAAAWLQWLCTVPQDGCPVMLSVRNEYIKMLLGYVSELRIVGPFLEFPHWGHLYTLSDAAKYAANKRPFTDPTSRETESFFSSQPVPTSGAFCYVAVTGELLESSLSRPPPVKTPPKKKKKKSGQTSLNMTLETDDVVLRSTPKSKTNLKTKRSTTNVTDEDWGTPIKPDSPVVNPVEGMETPPQPTADPEAPS